MPELILSQHLRAFALVVSSIALLPLSPSARAAAITSAKITEFVAKNRDGIVDEDGDQSDWLEIWNASGVAGDLGGWHLTDDPANLKKWTLPAIPITTGGYVVIFASGKDRKDPTGELHANFRIQSDAGGYLALVKPDGVTIATVFKDYPKQFADTAYGLGFDTETPLTFLVAGAQAKWHVPTGPVAGWMEAQFDDTAWSAGATGIGYDINWTETDLNTSYDHLFGRGGDVEEMMRSKNPSIYIRIPFEVPQPDGIGELKLRMKWDDGFVAYLNGTEFERQGAPANPAWNSSATNGNRDETDAKTFFEFPVDQGGLVQGTNVLAIQGLNSSAFNSDVLFVPELTGIFQDIEKLGDRLLCRANARHGERSSHRRHRSRHKARARPGVLHFPDPSGDHDINSGSHNPLHHRRQHANLKQWLDLHGPDHYQPHHYPTCGGFQDGIRTPRNRHPHLHFLG
jgi:hypothetical protein